MSLNVNQKRNFSKPFCFVITKLFITLQSHSKYCKVIGCCMAVVVVVVVVVDREDKMRLLLHLVADIVD